MFRLIAPKWMLSFIIPLSHQMIMYYIISMSIIVFFLFSFNYPTVSNEHYQVNYYAVAYQSSIILQHSFLNEKTYN